MPASPHVANMIHMYYIPTSAQQAGLGTAACLSPQEHPDPPRMPPPGVMLPVQQPAFIPQQGKKIIDKIIHMFLLFFFQCGIEAIKPYH
jgi:hypothetical protein